MTERLSNTANIRFSEDVAWIAKNLGKLELPPLLPTRLNSLNRHLQDRVKKTMDKIQERGQDIQVFGPDWCRENAHEAGRSHAEVIVKTYGSTYALPNKYPEANVKMLNDGGLDMYLLYENGKPVGTACMVIDKNGWAELGRAASLGSVGNELIQNMRILKWLNDDDLAKRVFGIFSTCRTAPDRNIGSEQNQEIMRGGQAVTHIWSKMPETMIGGFGPLYKKHGALEQFAYTMTTNGWAYSTRKMWVLGNEDRKFVNDWLNHYSIDKVLNTGKEGNVEDGFSVHYPPLESGLTEFIHGEITLGKHGEGFDHLETALDRLAEVKVPFIQAQIPIDKDSSNVQAELARLGFKAFLFTPGIMGKQSPLLWYGRLTPGVKVVPTFWDAEGTKNAFWNKQLSDFASRVAKSW